MFFPCSSFFLAPAPVLDLSRPPCCGPDTRMGRFGANAALSTSPPPSSSCFVPSSRRVVPILPRRFLLGREGARSPPPSLFGDGCPLSRSLHVPSFVCLVAATAVCPILDTYTLFVFSLHFTCSWGNLWVILGSGGHRFLFSPTFSPSSSSVRGKRISLPCELKIALLVWRAECCFVFAPGFASRFWTAVMLHV